MSCLPKLGRINIIRGQALNIEITVPYEVDLSGAMVTFGIADQPETPYTTTLPTSKSGQVITAKLSGTESELLTMPKHYYSCWLVIADDPTLVARGYINVTSDSSVNGVVLINRMQ